MLSRWCLLLPRALRLGLTVAGLAPAALWMWADLPEDAPTRVEARLRRELHEKAETAKAESARRSAEEELRRRRATDGGGSTCANAWRARATS